MTDSAETTTLEWFGTTTFRLRTKGLTIFLDTWVERPSVLQKFLSIDDVTAADYIFISHAHFDHLPGADLIALKTGAIVVANCEAINMLRNAGVPEGQLLPVSGGERIPLFTKEVREKGSRGEGPLRPAHAGVPPTPHPDLAVAAAHIWPSLHCLGPPGGMPDFMDTAEVYTGTAHPYVCTIDQTMGMKHVLLQLGNHVPRDQMDEGMKSFVDYVSDRKRNVMSHCDGGQIMVNLLINDKALLWNAHLGAYEGIVRTMEPKPDIAILGIAGRANLNGKPFDGSSAQFATNLVKWLGEPEKVIWCLHDKSPIKPRYIKTIAATEMIEQKTKSRLLDFEYNKPYVLDF